MANGRPTLSIIILNYFSKDYCVSCLESLGSSSWLDPKAEVIVIDNGSFDGAGLLIAARYPGVRFIQNRLNLGIAGGRRQGALLARGEAILFLDVDTTVLPGAIDVLIRAIAKPGVGVAGPALLSFDGKLQYSARLFPSLPGKIARRLPMFQSWAAREELRGWDHASTRDVDYVIGACLMVRREVIETVGTHYQKFFYGPDDVDFCLRAQLAGWRVLYEPSARVRHAERRVTRGPGLTRLKLRHAASLGYYFAKHRYVWSRRRLYGHIELARRQMVGADSGRHSSAGVETV